MRCSSNCVWLRCRSAPDESLNWNAECACACGTQAEGGTVLSAFAVDDEMAWRGVRGVRAGQNCGGGRLTAGHGVDWPEVRGGITASATGSDERWCARSTRHRSRAVGR